ncbi:8880_t:CDS:2, partial [Scutellospora calospora]
SANNSVVDVERGGFLAWGAAVKENAKIIIANQKSDVDSDNYQLWRYDDGWLVNKQSTLCLDAGSGCNLVLCRKKSDNKQRWILTQDGRIALQSQQNLVLEIKGSHVVLADNKARTFRDGPHSQFAILPVHSAKKIGVIRLELIEAENLKSVDSFLGGGKSDPYVRVFHESNAKDIIAQTRFLDCNLNPVWEEIFYLPVMTIGDKFILEVMDFNTLLSHKSLGQCCFEVTNELVKKNSENVYEETLKDIDILSTQGKIHYKVKFFPLKPLPKPTPDFLATLKEKPFDRSTLYTLVALQAPNGGFPPSDDLANLFGFDSQDRLIDLYKSQCCDERILKKQPTVWITIMISWFLRFLLKDCRSEWSGVNERAEKYVNKEINDLELEEIAVDTGRKVVCDRFEIEDDKKLISRETIATVHVKRILQCLQSNGSYQYIDYLAKFFGYENTSKLRTAFIEYKNRHTKSQKLSQINAQTWRSIIVLYFYRYIAIDQKNEWYPSYEKTYRWIWAQFKGNESLEQEAFQIVQSFIKECYGINDDVLEMDLKFEGEINLMISSIKNKNPQVREIDG